MPLGCQLMGSALRVFGLDGGMVLPPKDLSIIDLPNFVKRCYYVVVSFTLLRQRSAIKSYTGLFVGFYGLIFFWTILPHEREQDESVAAKPRTCSF